MKNSTKILIVIGVFILGGVVSYSYFMNSLKTQPIKEMGKAEYIEKAMPNCINGGMTKAECNCSYGKWIDAYGIQGTYNLDKLSIGNDNPQIPDAAIQLIAPCFAEGV